MYRHAFFGTSLILTLLLFPLALYAQSNMNQESAMHYSLYYENFKNKNYADALPDLLWILKHDPGFHRNTDINFERAVTTYEGLAETTEDAAQKTGYLVAGLAIHDRVLPVMDSLGGEVDAFTWTLDKGRYIQKHLDYLEEFKADAITAYRTAYRMQPDEMDPYYLDVLLGDLYASGDIGGALDFLRELQESRGEDEAIANLVRKYFTVIPPEEQIGFLEEQLAAKPDDTEVIQQLFDLYEQEGYHGKMMELAPRILELDPTTATLRMLTRLYLEDGDTEQAIAVFHQLTAIPDVEVKAQDYHNMGIAQLELENFGEAKRYYDLAIRTDAEYNAARKAIADLYATAASTCGVADREQAAVFWLIADAYSRAGDNAGAARMRTAFPTAEDVFYVQRWTNGESTTVSYSCRGLTISGSTTVRQR